MMTKTGYKIDRNVLDAATPYQTYWRMSKTAEKDKKPKEPLSEVCVRADCGDEDDVRYIKEMLKKFRLKDSKLMKTPMASDNKLTKDEEGESIDNTKYRATTHLGLWLSYGEPIYENRSYADSDLREKYVDERAQ
ncbi:hypothetical protein Tco_0774220 [Tanacetum coccineum]|uniref:Uncharacterized protein n=1 Tax=Tanacetum coccineum TaxID=301880 RepID=A0ABQ4ZMY0_9ASTR